MKNENCRPSWVTPQDELSLGCQKCFPCQNFIVIFIFTRHFRLFCLGWEILQTLPEMAVFLLCIISGAAFQQRRVTCLVLKYFQRCCPFLPDEIKGTKTEGESFNSLLLQKSQLCVLTLSSKTTRIWTVHLIHARNLSYNLQLPLILKWRCGLHKPQNLS